MQMERHKKQASSQFEHAVFLIDNSCYFLAIVASFLGKLFLFAIIGPIKER